MTSRERFKKAILGIEPDRPPLYVTVTPQVAQKLCKHTGLPYEEPWPTMQSTRVSHMGLMTALGADAIGIAACAPPDKPTIDLGNGITQNEWGMVFKDTGQYNEFHAFPLAHAESIKDILDYDFPDPHAPGRWSKAEQAMTEYGNSFGIIGNIETTLFETAWYLVGLEKFLMDLLMEAEYIEPLLDKIQEIHTIYGLKMIEMGVDMLCCGDDFGTQSSLIMDRGTFQRVFKPRIQEMFAQFKKANPDIKLAWHSCGAVRPLIPDFIEVGLDILNPIQPLARGMDPQELKDDFGSKLGFFGGICVQDLLPHGTPESIAKELNRRAEILGKEGGYIMAPAHNIQEDTPIENILAVFETVKNL